jgi:hypothetical protein
VSTSQRWVAPVLRRYGRVADGFWGQDWPDTAAVLPWSITVGINEGIGVPATSTLVPRYPEDRISLVRYHVQYHEAVAPPSKDKDESTPSGRRHDRYLPGFAAMARRRRQSLAEALVARRVELGLSQTEVAARMGTSQSAVARLEAGEDDVRLSSLQRYAAAVDQVLDWTLEDPNDR